MDKGKTKNNSPFVSFVIETDDRGERHFISFEDVPADFIGARCEAMKFKSFIIISPRPRCVLRGSTSFGQQERTMDNEEKSSAISPIKGEQSQWIHDETEVIPRSCPFPSSPLRSVPSNRKFVKDC